MAAYPAYAPRSSGPKYLPPAVRRRRREGRDDEEGKRLPSYRPEATRPRRVERVTVSDAAEAATPAPTVRPRMATAAPSTAAPMSPLERAAANRRMMRDAPVRDENGRLKSALGMLRSGGPLQPTDSFGNLLGQLIGRAGIGLLAPASDERARRRNVDIPQAEAAYEQELKMEKERRELELDAARRAQIEASAENLRAMPEYRAEEAERRRLEGMRRLDQGEVRLGQGDERLGQGERRLDQVDDRLTEQERANRAREAGLSERARSALESRERVAQWRIGAQEKIAAVGHAIRRDSQKLSAEQFQKRYPGAGKRINAAGIAKIAAENKMLPEDAAALAVKQGYQIIDDE